MNFTVSLIFRSSALLFLIVASENIQNGKFIGPDRNQDLTQEENVSFIEGSQDQMEVDRETQFGNKISAPLKSRELNEQSFQVSTSISTTWVLHYTCGEEKSICKLKFYVIFELM